MSLHSIPSPLFLAPLGPHVVTANGYIYRSLSPSRHDLPRTPMLDWESRNIALSLWVRKALGALYPAGGYRMAGALAGRAGTGRRARMKPRANEETSNSGDLEKSLTCMHKGTTQIDSWRSPPNFTLLRRLSISPIVGRQYAYVGDMCAHMCMYVRLGLGYIHDTMRRNSTGRPTGEPGRSFSRVRIMLRGHGCKQPRSRKGSQASLVNVLWPGRRSLCMSPSNSPRSDTAKERPSPAEASDFGLVPPSPNPPFLFQHTPLGTPAQAGRGKEFRAPRNLGCKPSWGPVWRVTSHWIRASGECKPAACHTSPAG